jgi:hypothetical protein
MLVRQFMKNPRFPLRIHGTMNLWFLSSLSAGEEAIWNLVLELF